MAKIAKKSAAKPFTLTVAGGQFAYIRGHVSTKDQSIKDRKFQVSTHAAKRQTDLDGQVLDRFTAIDIHGLIQARTGHDIPITVISAAVQILEQRIRDRKSGTKKRGPIETIPVAIDSNGRTVIEAIRNQKTGDWSLSLGPVEQKKQWTRKEGTVDHEAKSARLLTNCADKAADTHDTLTVAALINKVLPRSKGPDIRSFRLIGSKAITCDSIAIGGQSFTNMIDLVSAFRPDLVSLFDQTTEKMEITG
jgi:hypothetical protein